MTAIVPRLVRVQDRLISARDSAVWQINPRTGYLETRAGLSWTGVREYRTATGVLRVLRRPEQVNSPGHLRTLRRLTCCEGHPANGVDVSAANERELGAGHTGDDISIETIGGYPRPVSDVTASRLSTIARMLDAAGWRDYVERFPDMATSGISHDGTPARTGTSLGYNALWWGPYIEAEIVSERDDGSLVGEWVGPNGAEAYDVEHVVDPDCEIVQALVRNTGFDASKLGGNHFAICLQPLGGRGAEQSELLRVVDSIDVVIPDDLARQRGRVALQVPRSEVDSPGETSDLTIAPSVAEQLPAPQEPTMTTPAPVPAKIRIDIGMSRDVNRWLTKHGKTPITSMSLTVDEIDAPKLMEKLGAIQEICGDLMEMANAGDAAQMQMKDMLTAEQAQVKVDEMAAALKEAEAALVEAKAAEEKATTDGYKMKAAVDSLEAELAPLRAEQLVAFKATVVARGFDKAAVEACTDAAAVRRHMAVTKVGKRYGTTRDDGTFVLDDTLVAAAVEGFMSSAPLPTAAKPTAFAEVPRINLPGRDEAPDNVTPIRSIPSAM